MGNKPKKLDPNAVKFRQYESDLAAKRQNLIDPQTLKQFKFTRHVIGISEHPEDISFQILFSDNSRTKADSSALDDTKWQDSFIP